MDVVNVLDVFFSSSDEDESDDDFAVLDAVFGNHRDDLQKIPRLDGIIDQVINRYTDIQFQQHYRLQRATFQYILALIRPQLERASEVGRCTISPEKQLYIAIYVLATPDSYRSVTTKFDVGHATAWRAVKRVVKAIYSLRNYFIKWPTEVEARETAARIQVAHGFPGVLGAVDGSHIRIAKPSRESQSYVNRKGAYSIQLQGVCNDRLQFIHCYVGLPGSVHDMRVFKFSGLQQRCNDEAFFPDGMHILGDSAYTLQKNVMVPYRDNGFLGENEIRYNTIHSSSRMMIENAFGLLKNRWRYLRDSLPMTRTDLIPYYIMCACVLHNICLLRGDAFEIPVHVPDNLDNDVGFTEVPRALQREGVAKRNNIRDAI